MPGPHFLCHFIVSFRSESRKRVNRRVMDVTKQIPQFSLRSFDASVVATVHVDMKAHGARPERASRLDRAWRPAPRAPKDS